MLIPVTSPVSTGKDVERPKAALTAFALMPLDFTLSVSPWWNVGRNVTGGLVVRR